MSKADADKIDKVIKDEREKHEADEKKAIDEEKDQTKKEQRQKDLEEYHAVTVGMKEFADALRANPNAKPGSVISPLKGKEQKEKDDLESEKKKAQEAHDNKKTKELERSTQLKELEMSGKDKGFDVLQN